MTAAMSRSLQPKYKVSLSSGRMNKTTSSTSSSKTQRSYNLVSVVEGKGLQKGIVGMAVVDVRYPVVRLYEFFDSTSFLQLKTKLHVEEPVEVIVADSINERKNTLLLVEAIKNTNNQDMAITTVHKRYFCEKRGADLVGQLGNPEVSNCSPFALKQKKMCMAACAALLKYIEFIQNMCYAVRSLKIIYEDMEKTCMIDVGSWKCLELIDDNASASKKSCRRSLLSATNYTVTSGGLRLLRSNILQPLADKDAIEARLDAVEELCEIEHFTDRLREVLGRGHELDNVLTVFVQSTKEQDFKQCEANIIQLVRLKQTMDVIDPLRGALANVKCDILKDMKEKLADKRLDRIAEILDDTLNADVLAGHKRNSLTLRNQKCYAVKEGICVNLDVARKAYEEILSDLQSSDTTAELEEHLPNQNARLAFSLTRGFHYVWVTNATTARLPSIFTNEIRNRASITFTSKKLVRYNDRIDQCVAEVIVASSAVVQSLIEQIRASIPVLYNIMDITTTLDFLISLASYSCNTKTARPQMSHTLLFKEGRHPLLDSHLRERCVANDTHLTPDTNFAIITGPNMAGKSTYLRQVCQLSILCQAGCMVSADIAVVPVFTRIFSRVGHNDSLGNKRSAFALEMEEMGTIMQYADERSLIVIDELARSTSTEEGLAISYAISEFLVERKSFVFLATHLLDLASLDSRYISVENFHFHPQSRIDSDGREVFDASHKLYKGPYTGPLYGFELAALTTFPPEVVKNARKMAQRLKNANEKRGQLSSEMATHRLLVRTAVKLRQTIAISDSTSEEQMVKFLVSIRSKMRRGLNEVDEMIERERSAQKDAILTTGYEELSSQQETPVDSQLSEHPPSEDPPSSEESQSQHSDGPSFSQIVIPLD